MNGINATDLDLVYGAPYLNGTLYSVRDTFHSIARPLGVVVDKLLFSASSGIFGLSAVITSGSFHSFAIRCPVFFDTYR